LVSKFLNLHLYIRMKTYMAVYEVLEDHYLGELVFWSSLSILTDIVAASVTVGWYISSGRRSTSGPP